jgi:replicative DNA helicase
MPDVGRTPPHNLDAEKAALGSVFIRPDALDDLSHLHVNDFFLPIHREIFDAMRTVAARGRTVDPITVYDELKVQDLASRLDGGIGYLMALMNETPTAENVGHYGRIVAEKALLRRIITTAAQIQSSAYGDFGNMTEFLAEARSMMASLELHGGGRARRMGDEMERVAKQIEQRGLFPDRHGITTGLRELDEILGPMRPDNLVAIGANTGRGKTALAWNIAVRSAYRGIPVMFFTLEMSIDQLIERALTMDARINGRQVSQGKLQTQDWTKIHGSMSRLFPLPLWINDDRMTGKQLVAELRVWRAHRRRERIAAGLSEDEAELALGVVDYVQLLEQDDESESRYVEVGKNSRQLKLATKRNDCNMPIIELVQLNRENIRRSKDGKPTPPILSDLRDAGNLEQDADMIMFTHWDGTPPHTGPHPAEVHVRKNRPGVLGVAHVQWEAEFMTFSDRPDDDDGQADLWQQ